MAQSTQVQREAKRCRIPWSHVRQMARELRQVERDANAPLHGARQLAWRLYCQYVGRSASCHPFWWIGFEHVLSRLADKGLDYTAIPHYDEIADEVAGQFPEWRERGCDDFWAFLESPCRQQRTGEQFLDAALATLLNHRGPSCTENRR